MLRLSKLKAKSTRATRWLRPTRSHTFVLAVPRECRLGRQALRDLERIDDWWRANRPAAPGLFSNELDSALALLATVPGIGTPYPASSRSCGSGAHDGVEAPRFIDCVTVGSRFDKSMYLSRTSAFDGAAYF